MSANMTTVRSLARLFPLFVCLATVGTLFGYFVLRIRDESLGTIVAVPLIVACGMTRALMVVVPFRMPRRIRSKGKARIYRLLTLIAAIPVFVGLFGAVMLLGSSLIYWRIGMPAAANASIAWSERSFAGVIAGLIFLVVAAAIASQPIDVWFLSLVSCVVKMFWSILRLPYDMARWMKDRFGGHTFAHHP